MFLRVIVLSLMSTSYLRLVLLSIYLSYLIILGIPA